jgi:hypothetical protein
MVQLSSQAAKKKVIVKLISIAMYLSNKRLDSYKFNPMATFEHEFEFDISTRCVYSLSKYLRGGKLMAYSSNTNLLFCKKEGSSNIEMDFYALGRSMVFQVDPSQNEEGLRNASDRSTSEIKTITCNFDIEIDFGLEKLSADFKMIYTPQQGIH